MIYEEISSKRKHDRVFHGLDIRIHEKTYQTLDWSVSGLMVKDYEGSEGVGTKIWATLFIPFHEITMQMPVQLQIVRREQGILGCAFIGLSESNKNVLHHVIDAFKGEGEDVRDVLNSLEQPLHEGERHLLKGEEGDLKRFLGKFPNRKWIFGVLGAVFVIAFGLFVLQSLYGRIKGNLNQKSQYELVAAIRIKQAESEMMILKAKLDFSKSVFERMNSSEAPQGVFAANQMDLLKQDILILDSQRRYLGRVLELLVANQKAVAEGNYFYEVNVLNRFGSSVLQDLSSDSSIFFK